MDGSGQRGSGMAAMLAKTATTAAAQGQVWGMRRRRRRAVGEPGGDVEEPVAQRFRLASCEGGGVVDAAEQAGPRDEVGGDRGQDQPGLVDLELPRGEPAPSRSPWRAGSGPRLGHGRGGVLRGTRVGRCGCWSRRLGSATHRPLRTATAARRGGVVRGARSRASRAARWTDRAARSAPRRRPRRARLRRLRPRGSTPASGPA